MNFTPMNFVYSLKWMGIGMVGIFVVIGAIILSTMLLAKITAPKSDRK